MITLDALKLYGANTAEGMARCLNNESFYLKMVGMALADKNFDKLKEAMDTGDAHAAFAAAHSLKGAIGNVALTPIYAPICELTELLRGKDATVPGAEALSAQILSARDKALSL